MDMKPQTVEMQEWLGSLVVERADHWALKDIGIVVASWVFIFFIAWMSGLFN